MTIFAFCAPNLGSTILTTVLIEKSSRQERGAKSNAYFFKKPYNPEYHHNKEMNFGQHGRELLLDLKRSDWLPPYNDENVRATIEEISLHFDELVEQVTATQQMQDEDNTSGSISRNKSVPMEERPAMTLHDAAIKRNKQYLLAYHAYRINKLRELRSETSSVFPSHLRPLLCEAEADFWNGMDQLISNYSADIDLNLNSDLSPPEDDFLEIRVVQPNLGRITTELGGSVALEVGTTHYLRRGDVEHLIRQGSVIQLYGEETG